MSDFIDDISGYIITAGFGVLGTTLVNTSRGAIPGGAGPIVAITETGGTGLINTHDPITQSYPQPALQIVVHATNASVARARAKEIFALLMVVRNQTIGGAFYLSLMPDQSEPFDMGLDSIKRARFTFNIRAFKTFS